MSSPIQNKVVLRVLGSLLSMFSITMLPPVVVGLIYQDGAILPFVLAFITTLATGLVLLWPVREERASLRLRDGFVVVVMFWAVLSVFGGLPFLLSPELDLSIAAAIFIQFCFTGNKCNGLEEWELSYWPLLYCPC